jgi:hypothetical protein
MGELVPNSNAMHIILHVTSNKNYENLKRKSMGTKL